MCADTILVEVVVFCVLVVLLICCVCGDTILVEVVVFCVLVVLLICCVW